MEYNVNKRKYYPIIGIGLAFSANLFLFFDLLVWFACAVAANLFLTTGTLLEAAAASEWNEKQTPTRIRIPLRPLFLALIGAIVSSIVAGNAVYGLMAAFGWGLLILPLVAAILRRDSFGTGLRGALLWGAGGAAVTFVAQVIWSSPGFSFRTADVLGRLHERLTTLLDESLQTISQSGDSETEALLQTFLGGGTTRERAAQISLFFLRLTPAFYAIAVLAAACVLWWSTKRMLKSTSFPVAPMGRFDSFTPGRTVILLYFACFLIGLFSASDSAMNIAATNGTYILSAALAYGGVSLIAFFLNRKITSKTFRIIALVAIVWLAMMTQIGIWLLVLIGILSSGRNLRGGIGGNLH